MVQLSIVIPAHNEGDDLRRTVESARADIGDRLRYEVIVVDDASTDGCGENLDLRAGDTLLRHEQQAGVSTSKAAGCEAATGDVILMLDGHCKPAGGALPALHRRVAETGAPVVPRYRGIVDGRWEISYAVRGHARWWDTATLKGHWIGLDRCIELGDGLYEAPGSGTGIFALPREVYHHVGGFDPGLIRWGCTDQDLTLRLILAGHRILHDATIDVGHRFRRQFPYKVTAAAVLANRLRVAFKLLDDRAFAAWSRDCRKREGDRLYNQARELFEANQSDAERQRDAFRAIQKRTIHWYNRRWRQLEGRARRRKASDCGCGGGAGNCREKLKASNLPIKLDTGLKRVLCRMTKQTGRALHLEHGTMRYLGHGKEGAAFVTQEGIVVKLALKQREADAARCLLGADHGGHALVHHVGELQANLWEIRLQKAHRLTAAERVAVNALWCRMRKPDDRAASRPVDAEIERKFAHMVTCLREAGFYPHDLHANNIGRDEQGRLILFDFGHLLPREDGKHVLDGELPVGA